MKTTYAAPAGTGPTYEIESDRHGNYTIKHGNKLIKRVSSITNYLGKPRWGSRKMEDDAIQEAKAFIDGLH